MKIYNHLFRWGVIALATSCSVKEQLTNIPASTGEISIVATTEGESETRTALDKDYSTVLWLPQDEISVFSGGNMGKFTSSNTEKAKTADFKGTLQGDESVKQRLYGLYPYDKDATIAKDVITTSLPAEQEGIPGSFADGLFISVSQTDSYEMGFKNVCSGLRFMLDREGIQCLTFLSNGGEPLAGQFSIGFGKYGEPVVNTVADGVSEVKISAPSGKTFEAGVWYYLVTLPATLEKGYTILVEGDGIQGAVRSSKPLSLNRNKFRSAKLDATRVDYKKESEYYIENDGVRAFIGQVDYSDDSNYDRSDVSKYHGTDKPNPVSLSWEGKASFIQISTSPDLSDYQEIKVDSSPASVYNLIPGVRYYYSVVAGDGSILHESCVIPEGNIRMINGVTKNMRDMGGWKAGDKTIRYGRIYRGARLDDIQSNPSAKTTLLDDLGISVDLDLRGLPSGSQGGSGEYNPWTPKDPVKYVNIKLWHYFLPSASQYQIPDIAEGSSADQYQYAIRSIIDWLKNGETVYFHCHGGADRTGTLAFLIEGLLGVSESDLSKDYELTSYAGSDRKRNGSAGWFYKPMIRYIRTFAPEKDINEQVTAWAKTRHSDKVDPLSDDEIQLLKDLMLE